MKLTGLEFNLKLFETDQRKGLVRVDNRYVAKCGKKKMYDSEVEYIESTGTQWIDTLYVLASSNSMRVNIEFISVSNNYNYAKNVFGSDDAHGFNIYF